MRIMIVKNLNAPNMMAAAKRAPEGLTEPPRVGECMRFEDEDNVERQVSKVVHRVYETGETIAFVYLDRAR